MHAVTVEDGEESENDAGRVDTPLQVSVVEGDESDEQSGGARLQSEDDLSLSEREEEGKACSSSLGSSEATLVGKPSTEGSVE
jgi:hypothetical protein